MKQNNPSPCSVELLSNRLAAEFLGVQPATLKTWRWRGVGPQFIKLGNQPGSRVAYRRSDLIAWLDARTFGSTAAATVRGTS